ncbi:MAG TPA: hypothetical protein VMT46_12770 [Anaerolineaceae bacterium]|nr:hypothetical protein [Anaerolineaceae bacterium]
MKPFKIGLRIWIALTSLVSFVAGWALLSHANKPAPLLTSNTGGADPLPLGSASARTPVTLPPIPSLDSLVGNQSASSSSSAPSIQPLPSLPSTGSSSFLPRIRTRGS